MDVLVRAAQDRVLADGGGKLFDGLEGRPEEAHAVDLPARPGQKARTARISVRFGAVTLRRPRHRPAEPGAPKSQPVFLVEARELDPPAGVPPAHWRLLTSHRVETHDQARWITRLYRRRWTIEQLFRTVKTKGFDIEAVSMETAPFRVLCAMTLVAGVSCLQLVQDRDGEGGRPLSDVFDEADRTALEVVSATLEGGTERQKNPHPPGSLAFAAWVCARLGGWTGCYGKPGPVVMLGRRGKRRRVALGGDKAFDVAAFVDALRGHDVTPHIAIDGHVNHVTKTGKPRKTGIGRRTTRHPGYAASQPLCKLIEEVFGWIKTTGGLGKTRHRGLDRVGWMFTLTAAGGSRNRIRSIDDPRNPPNQPRLLRFSAAC